VEGGLRELPAARELQGGEHMLLYVMDSLRAALREEEGQGLAEYALILFFIAVVAIAALTFLGSDISSLLSRVANSL
jgi:pilus assembly protein Flp/PilA